MKTRKFSSAINNYFHELADLTGSGTVKLESYQAIVVQGPHGTFRGDDEPRLIAWLDNAPEQLCGFIHAIFPRQSCKGRSTRVFGYTGRLLQISNNSGGLQF